MGNGARSLKVDPNACRELQTFWDGMIEIDVSAADYDVAATLGNTIMVRGIESGDVSGGNAIKIDHLDVLGTGTPAKRTGITIYVNMGSVKSPMPEITKVYQTGTTALKIRLYYQTRRA